MGEQFEERGKLFGAGVNTMTTSNTNEEQNDMIHRLLIEIVAKNGLPQSKLSMTLNYETP